MIDEEISRIVRDSQRLADEILRKDIDILHRLAKELLKYETLDSKDLEIILNGKDLTRPLNAQANNSKPNRKRQKRIKSDNIESKTKSEIKNEEISTENLKKEPRQQSKKAEAK